MRGIRRIFGRQYIRSPAAQAAVGVGSDSVYTHVMRLVRIVKVESLDGLRRIRWYFRVCDAGRRTTHLDDALGLAVNFTRIKRAHPDCYLY